MSNCSLVGVRLVSEQIHRGTRTTELRDAACVLRRDQILLPNRANASSPHWCASSLSLFLLLFIGRIYLFCS
jgi:hypothetical protein